MSEPLHDTQRQPGNTARPEPSTPQQYPVGILHVHGMGQQRRGETLTGAGDVLVSWLDRWLAGGLEEPQDSRAPTGQRPLKHQGGEGRYVRVLSPDGQVTRPQSDRPAEVELEVRVPGSGNELAHTRWLMAESWWAEQFEPASFRGLAWWGFGVLPYVVLSHFVLQLNRLARWAKEKLGLLTWPAIWFGGTMLALFTTLVTMAVLVIVILLLILELLPIPGTAALVRGAQQLLANYLGDSQVLLISPIGREAIVRTVRRDIEMMMRRCRSVIVVAHSQGGAVAHMALRREYGGIPREWRAEGRQIALFTYGSGLAKLELTRQNAVMWDRPAALAGQVATLGALGILTTTLYLNLDGTIGGFLGLLLLPSVIILGIFWALLTDALWDHKPTPLEPVRRFVSNLLNSPIAPLLAVALFAAGVVWLGWGPPVDLAAPTLRVAADAADQSSADRGLRDILRLLGLVWYALPFWAALTIGAILGRLGWQRRMYDRIEPRQKAEGPDIAEMASEGRRAEKEGQGETKNERQRQNEEEQWRRRQEEEQRITAYKEALVPQHAFGAAIPWYDYYASQDIVPNGSLTDDPTAYQSLGITRSAKVFNRSSVIADHNAYWLNLDGFVGAVAVAAARLDPTVGRRVGALKPLDDVWLEAARCRRRTRAWALLCGRVMVLLLFAWMAWQLHNLLSAQQVIRWLESTPASASGLTALMAGLLGYPLIAPLVGLIIPALIALFISMTVEALWRLWEWDDVNALFDRKPYTTTFLRLYWLNCLLWVSLPDRFGKRKEVDALW